MENLASSRRHRLSWFALATCGALLLLPATRYLVRSQMQMEMLHYSIPSDQAAERAAAARMPNDYPVQLALATDMPAAYTPVGLPVDWNRTDPMALTKVRNRRIAALEQRFPKNPSVYANLLRYMALGELRLLRNDGDPPPTAGTAVTPTIPYRPSPETVALFENAAQKGVELDPNNAYFRMMQSIGLFNAHRDTEALEALKAAGRCSRWVEYFQDDVDGRDRLQVATYGEQGAVRRTGNAANLLFPQYASFRAEARLVQYLAANAERAGNSEEAIAVRHALMRCGGLMRAQGASYITSLVGIAIVNIGTANPGGIEKPGASTADSHRTEDAIQRRARRLQAYYAYLESHGHPEEAAWARTEIAAGEQAKAIGTEALPQSNFAGPTFFRLGFAWLTNLVLLSSALVLTALGGAAALAGVLHPRRGLAIWRCVYSLSVLGGIGFWQWQAARVGLTPYVEVQNMFSGESGNGASEWPLAVQSLVAGSSLLVPMLFVGLIAGIARFQRVPLATGLGRGLRGAAAPVAAVLFLLYGASLLPTVSLESTIKADLTRSNSNEPRCFAESCHKVWPGDPQP